MMRYSSLGIYKDVEHMRTMVAGMVRFEEIESHFDKTNLTKKIVTGGMVVGCELVWYDATESVQGLVTIDNGLDTIKVIMNYEEATKLDYGMYMKAEIMGYWKVETGKPTVLDTSHYKLESHTIIGKYEVDATTEVQAETAVGQVNPVVQVDKVTQVEVGTTVQNTQVVQGKDVESKEPVTEVEGSTIVKQFDGNFFPSKD